jgi:hypothetical protein
MTRNTAAVESSYQLPLVRHRLLCDINSTTGGNLHVCTGGNFIYTGANTYSPIGGAGTVDPVAEGSDVFARAVRLQMAAVNTSQIVDLAAENLFNKPVALWRCVLDESLTMIDTPQLLFKGKINTAHLVVDDPEKGNYYEVEVESRLKQNPKAMYFNRQTLWTAMNFSGDTFFDQLVNIPNFVGEWGKQATNYARDPGNGNGGRSGGGGGRPGGRPN